MGLAGVRGAGGDAAEIMDRFWRHSARRLDPSQNNLGSSRLYDQHWHPRPHPYEPRGPRARSHDLDHGISTGDDANPDVVTLLLDDDQDLDALDELSLRHEPLNGIASSAKELAMTTPKTGHNDQHQQPQSSSARSMRCCWASHAPSTSSAVAASMQMSSLLVTDAMKSSWANTTPNQFWVLA